MRPPFCFPDLPNSQLWIGEDKLVEIAAHPDVDVVLAAIVGSAGLRSTWAALESGKTVALANKETLVMAGPLAMDLARERNARVLPVDSEHSAIFQAINGEKAENIQTRDPYGERRSISQLFDLGNSKRDGENGIESSDMEDGAQKSRSIRQP